jgi:hypothetical protein
MPAVEKHRSCDSSREKDAAEETETGADCDSRNLIRVRIVGVEIATGRSSGNVHTGRSMRLRVLISGHYSDESAGRYANSGIDKPTPCGARA